jgi:biopolymer transport protein ExbD
MTRITTSSLEAFRTMMLLSIVCGIVFANAGAQQLSPALSLAVCSSPPAAQTSAAKLKLNGEDVGTTADTSVLARRLTEIFAQRREKGPFTDERARSIDGTVFIRAENSVQLSEVRRVIEALARNHGIPYLAVEVDPARGKVTGDPVITNYVDITGGGNYEIHSNHFPRSMMLVVTVGNLGSNGGEMISDGIYLSIPEFTLRLSARQSVAQHFTVVEVFRDNEYVVGDNQIHFSALRSELQARLSRNEDKRVVILTRSDSDIRWSSFLEAANAAREAGAGKIQTHNLIP